MMGMGVFLNYIICLNGIFGFIMLTAKDTMMLLIGWKYHIIFPIKQINKKFLCQLKSPRTSQGLFLFAS
jgi:hypothetical protein